MSIHAAFCRSGVSTTDYSQICKATDVSAPVLSIVTNLAVMMLTIWKAWYVPLATVGLTMYGLRV